MVHWLVIVPTAMGVQNGVYERARNGSETKSGHQTKREGLCSTPFVSTTINGPTTVLACLVFLPMHVPIVSGVSEEQNLCKVFLTTTDS